MKKIEVSSCLAAATLVAASFFHLPAHAYCFAEAAAAYGVKERDLRAIAKVESALKANAVNASHFKKTNSRDLGLMQVNSRWVKREPLKSLGYSEASLMEPCTNVKVGAWILAGLLRAHSDYWDAIGAYNAACTQLRGDGCLRARRVYAWKVYEAMKTL